MQGSLIVLNSIARDVLPLPPQMTAAVAPLLKVLQPLLQCPCLLRRAGAFGGAHAVCI